MAKSWRERWGHRTCDETSFLLMGMGWYWEVFSDPKTETPCPQRSWGGSKGMKNSVKPRLLQSLIWVHGLTVEPGDSFWDSWHSVRCDHLVVDWNSSPFPCLSFPLVMLKLQICRSGPGSQVICCSLHPGTQLRCFGSKCSCGMCDQTSNCSFFRLQNFTMWKTSLDCQRVPRSTP